ncbi:MAG TPA: hypothetical protein VOB72_27325, partial [Candidatus Dormibacteraeota bacterium]|nr:hypothetical protein [Candidatus Dormibacteraeota bacterium]
KLHREFASGEERRAASEETIAAVGRWRCLEGKRYDTVASKHGIATCLDRDRFVREVRAILADYEPRQRLNELLSVAAAVPGLAVILQWARRRRP